MLSTTLLSYFNFYYGSKAHAVFPEMQLVGGMSQLKKFEKILESSFFTGGKYIYIILLGSLGESQVAVDDYYMSSLVYLCIRTVYSMGLYILLQVNNLSTPIQNATYFIKFSDPLTGMGLCFPLTAHPCTHTHPHPECSYLLIIP